MSAAPHSFMVALESEAAAANLMADLALLLTPGDIVALSGELGAGKTTAARALIRYLAYDDALEVPSPTFTLMQTYELPGASVLHADLYRIADPTELDEIGLFPLQPQSIALIEWPDRAGSFLSADRIEIALSHRPAQGAQARTAQIIGHGRAELQVARLAALRSFMAKAGYAAALRERMPGDASTRSYARLRAGASSFILMNMPKRPDGPAIHNGKSYSAAVHLAEDVRPFVAIANGLRSFGVSSPRIEAMDLEAGFLVTEDFGSEPVISGDPPAPILARYQASTDLLASFHERTLPVELPITQDARYAIPPFDSNAMLIEVGLMPDWYLVDRGVAPSEAVRAEFDDIWRELLVRLDRAPQTWVLRDFHSPNIIWLPDREGGPASVGVLDFQDAVLGPPSYDLVSLLQDARIDVPEPVELSLLGRYIAARRTSQPDFDVPGFAALYALTSAQRNTRLLGTFARLNRRDGKPHYLRHQPRVWDYLTRSLAHPSLSELRDWFAAHVPPPVEPY